MPLLSTRGGGSAKGFGFGATKPTISVDYLIVAGGGSAGSGAGGAGGYRTSFPGGTQIKLTKGVTVPVTVGGGASAAPPATGAGSNGTDSSFSTITSTAGGGSTNAAPASPGGSGAGGGYTYSPVSVNFTGGTGNSPPTTPPQGNPGGNGNGYGVACEDTNGGGGGASSAGQTITGSPLGRAGAGGNGSGVPTNFVPASYGTSGPSPTMRYFAGGGGGGAAGGPPVPSGGYGGGGNGQAFGRTAGCGVNPAGPTAGSSGTINTGGGGGGGFDQWYAGGSGIVLINIPSASVPKANLTLAPGTNTLVTNPDGSKTAVFTVSGSITSN
jgi:hypothetical protein